MGVLKPIETGVIDKPHDGTLLLKDVSEHNKAMATLSVDDIVPIQYALPAAPFVASGGKDIDLSIVDEALHKIEALCDVVLIEGAGGLMVPVDGETMMIDLISHFDAKALLVTHCRLGCINDTLLSIAALRQAGVAFEWAFNCKEGDSDFAKVSEPYFSLLGINTLHISDDLESIAKRLIPA